MGRTARVTIRWHRLLTAAAIVCGFAALLSTPVAGAVTTRGAVISNGTVQLGVNDRGDLNYNCVGAGDTGCPGPSAGNRAFVVGLRYVPLNLDAISPGCACEGWGLADAGSGLTGYANEGEGDANITVDSFDAPSATQAISTVTIADAAITGHKMQIVQDYRPSRLSPNLFVDSVTVTNTGTNTLTDLRYRRVMDWDVEPTAFSEWVTIQGTSPLLLFDSDDGFASSDPLSGPSDIDSETSCGPGYTGPCQFTDLGSSGSYPTETAPNDHGALFDFGLGQLAAGESRSFNIYYGAADSETAATAALGAVGAQVYSLGESNCTGDTIATCFDPMGNAGVEQGKPATFMFGFGVPEPDTVFGQPDTVIDGLTVSGNSVEGTFHGVWQNPESAVRVLRCQIDDQPWTVCTSPKSYGGLPAGNHVLRVTAVEDGLWDQTPAERTFTIASEPSPDLVPIDGGPGYYGQFSNPLPTDSSYFPIGVWLESVLSQADVDEDKAAGLNLYVLLTANSNLALVRGNGMRSIIQSGERTRFTDIGAETAAWELYDEIDMQQGPNGGYTTLENILNGLPQDGRARYNNYGKGVLFWETDAEAARFINEFQHVQSADGYFFTDPFICGPSEGGGVPEVVKTDGCRVAANYGWIVDRTRYLDGLDGQRKPVWAFVEVGWPFSESAAQGGRAIAPPEIRAAVWQSIIAGARGIIYFNHSFGGPCPAQHALRDPCYAAQRAMVTSVNAQITQLAPVLNAPFDVSFADASSSVRAMTKYYNGTYYVFAGSRENRPSTATFSVRSGSQAVVEGEGRIIPITDGRFSDDFAGGNAIHIYRIK